MSELESGLSPRKQHILRAVIRDYILTAEPVGSRTLSKKYGLGLSPATIRNELSDLEDEGLLRQPHTSAGRVPSDHGYRVYVDTLMDRNELSDDQRVSLERISLQPQDLPDLLQQTAKIAALLAGCTAMVRAPRKAVSRIKFVQLVPVNDADVLLVLLTDQGQVTNQVVRLPSEMSVEELTLVANFLNDQLRGRSLDQLTAQALVELGGQFKAYQELLTTLWSRMAPPSESDDRVYVSHQSYLATQPEFSEVGKVGQILSLLERDPLMAQLMDSLADAHGSVGVSIGAENPVPGLQECSVITATYRLGDRILGEVAVLGPTRMHYAGAMAAVEAAAERLSRALAELYGLEAPSGGHLVRRRI